ncbi:hypothetical protein FD20_GL000332 [Liquorilactobacillus uvarum DSM 19971]|uniref:Uncharacterized protein n=1 Tax=Liquorilactobacillus uvarum DSM 19971 TaxID=1423812 RepID=A0A0R1Q7Z0_9LACO|nr:hypothetical protein FD20_GL000332 [Liquorilactobacillus uvarum DSM 19971]
MHHACVKFLINLILINLSVAISINYLKSLLIQLLSAMIKIYFLKKIDSFTWLR